MGKNTRKYAIFYNGTFNVLLKLKEKEVAINGEKYAPLLFREIGDEIGLSRQTVAKHIQRLETEEFIKIIQKGRIQITKKGNEAIKNLK